MAVHCLNELITNALHHVPDVLTYLSRLKNQSVFNFCAIPQVSYAFKWFFIVCSPADEKLEDYISWGISLYIMSVSACSILHLFLLSWHLPSLLMVRL